MYYIEVHVYYSHKAVHKVRTGTHQRHKQVVKDKVHGHEYGYDFMLASLPHGQVHDLIPTFLGQYLEHGHGCLRRDAKHT